MSRRYDFAVIGGGLEGVILSALLSKNGKKTVLIEASPKLGGLFHSTQTSTSKIDTILNVLSDNEECNSVLSFLSDELGLSFDTKYKLSAPLTNDRNTFQPFVGFGDAAPAYVDWLQPYTSGNNFEITTTIETLIQALQAKYQFEVLENSVVTQMDLEENKATNVIINGKDSISADHYITTTTPLKLSKWNKSLLTQKFLQKLSKSKFWTTLTLDLVHDQKISDHSGYYILRGSKDEWFAGRFLSSVDKNEGVTQASQWVAFVPTELENDSEYTANIYKEIKKTVSKTFPEAMKQVSFEKLTLISHSHAHIPFKLNQENPFNGIKNLWFCNSKAHTSFNPLAGAVLASKELYMDLQIHGHTEKISDFNGLGSEPSPEAQL